MSLSKESSQVRRYLQLTQDRRSGGPDSLIPPSHKVNWSDAPLKFSILRDSARIPLSTSLRSAPSPRTSCLRKAPAWARENTAFDDLSDLLFLTHGLLGRKSTITWNSDAAGIANRSQHTFTRGTASAGGLYPIDLYVVQCGPSELCPGIYQYDVAHNALARVRMGNFASAMASIMELEDTTKVADLFIVVTANFWRNAFKYHNYGYQLLLHDVGASIASIEYTASEFGWKTATVYWFRDRSLASLLGLDLRAEAPFTIVAIRCKAGNGSLCRSSENSADSFAIRNSVCERSRHKFIPELAVAVHNQTLLDTVTRPGSRRRSQSEGLPQENMREIEFSVDLAELFRERQTSWGLLRKHPGVERSVLEGILSFSVNSASYDPDVLLHFQAFRSLRLVLFLGGVEGLDEGVYEYDIRTRQLSLIAAGRPDKPLQKLYRLDNFNLDEAGVLLAIIGRLEELLAALGPRGIRLMNAEAGVLAQRVYMACANYSLGCGIVAGFDPLLVNKNAGIDGTSEISLLVALIGSRPLTLAQYDFSL